MCAEPTDPARPDAEYPGSPDPSDPPREPTRRRRWLRPAIITAGVLVLLIVLVALVPALLSTQAGARFVANRVSEDVHGDVTIGSVSLTWFGPQRARDVVVFDQTGSEALHIDHAETEISLFAALRGRHTLGNTQLTGIRAELFVDDAGDVNLARALEPVEPPDPREPTRVSPTLQFNIALRDAHITIHGGADREPVYLENIEGDAVLEAIHRPLRLQLAGRSRHADFTGGFTASGELANLFAEDGTLTPRRITGSANANADDLPVQAIDHLLNLDGLLTAAAGDRANLALALAGDDGRPRFSLAAEAPRLRARARGVIDQRAAALEEPANVDMQLEPGLARRLLGLELQEAVPIELELTDLRAPVDAFDPARTAVTATVRFLEPARFLDEQGRPFAIRNAVASITSENVAQALELQLAADLDVEDEVGDLRLAGTFADLFDEAARPRWDRLQADLVAEANNLPTILADRLLQQDGLLLEALGDRVSLRARTESVGADEIDAELAINAPRLRTETMRLAIDADWVTLVDPPVEAQLLIAPRVASQVVAAVTLAEPEPALAIIHALQAPRPAAGEPLFQPERTQIDFQLTGDRAIALLELPEIDRALADDFEMRLNGPSLSDLRLTLSTVLHDGEADTRITQLAGSPLQAVLQVDTGLTRDFDRQPMETLLTLDSEQITGRLVGTIAPDWSSLTVTEASTLNMRLTRATLAALDMDEQFDETLLEEPLQLALTIEELVTGLPVDLAAFEMTAVADVIAEAAEQRTDAFAIWLGGERARLNLQAGPAPGAQDQTRLNLDIAAERLRGDLAADVAQVEDRATLALVEPATLQAVLSQPALRILNAIDANDEPLLLGDVPLTARITALQGQVQPLDLQTMVAEAELETDRIEIARTALAQGPQDRRLSEAGPAADVPNISRPQVAESPVFLGVIAQLQPQPVAQAPQQQLDDNVGAVLHDVRSQLSFEGREQRGSLQLTGRTEIPGQAEQGRLQFQAVASQLLPEGRFRFSAADVEADIDIERLPTALIATFVGYHRQLLPLLGPLANLSAVAQWQGLPPRQGTIDARLRTTHLTAPFAFRIIDGMLELAEPSRARLNLTPEAYDALTVPEEGKAGEAGDGNPDGEAPGPPRSLVEPAELELEIHALRWPMPQPAGEDADADNPTPAVDPADLAFVATLTTDAMTFATGADGRPATLSFVLRFDGEDFTQPAPYQLTGRIRPAGPLLTEAPEDAPPPEAPDPLDEEIDVAAIPQPEGAFDFAGSVSQLIDSAGRPNFEAMTLDLQGNANDLPVAWLDDWLRQEGRAFAALGPELDLEVAARLQQMSGSIELHALATNGDAHVVGNLDEGVFLPTEPITASLQVTEAMGSRVLWRIHPIFETAMSGTEPIRFDIPTEGVSIPVRPFDLDEASIPVANLEIGQLAMRRGGTLAMIMTGVEGIIGRSLDTDEHLEAWFTPAVFRLDNGRLRYDHRLDVLLDQRLQLATWGEIDFRDETLAMSLAIPAGMLEGLFGFSPPDDGMFVIPMRGRVGEIPEVDWGRAATDIGRLTAQAELARRQPLAGRIFGELVGELLDTDVPEPSARPLPWADAPLEDLPEADPPDVDPEELEEPEEPEEPEEERDPIRDPLRDLLDRIP